MKDDGVVINISNFIFLVHKITYNKS